MLIVAFLLALLIAFVVLYLSVVAAGLKRDLNEFSRAESLGFLRLTLVGLFGIVLTQAITPLAIRWWLVSILSLLLTTILLLGSQLVAKNMSQTGIGKTIANSARSWVKRLDIAFSPIASKPDDEPEEFEQELIESVEDFSETIVREIMVPRVDMVTISGEIPANEALKAFVDSGFSRLPVRGKNIDDLKGVLYLKDLTRIMTNDPKSLREKCSIDLARKTIFTPDSKPVDDLLREMQLAATHLAIVIDEYGGVAGLVTMEDVIEELVGEIADEYDRYLPDIEELSDGSLRVSAKSSLFELGEFLELDLEDADIDSVGGLVTKILGRLPRGGDQVEHQGLLFETEKFEGRNKQLRTVMVRRL